MIRPRLPNQYFIGSQYSRRADIPFVAAVRLFANHSTTRLAAYRAPREFARPLILQVDMTSSNELIGAAMLAGLSTTNVVDWSKSTSGALAIRYGAGGGTSFRLIDMRPGTYQLPPCEAVSVEMWKWNATGDASAGAGTVGVAITEGTTAFPTEATVTAEGLAIPAAQTDTITLAAGARYWNIGTDDAAGSLSFDGAAAMQAGSVSAFARNPPAPRWDVNGAAAWGASTFSVTNDSAGAIGYTVQQYIEL
jgi:hypothetical protein